MEKYYKFALKRYRLEIFYLGYMELDLEILCTWHSNRQFFEKIADST